MKLLIHKHLKVILQICKISLSKSLLSLLLVPVIFSCNQESIIHYHGQPGVNFSSDTLYVSLGDLPYNVQDSILKIPIEILGLPNKDRSRQYAFDIDSRETTALPHKHYSILSRSFEIAPGKLTDTILIQLHRQYLEEDKVYRLSLHLVPTSDFPISIEEYRHIGIEFSNKLDMPEWWSEVAYWVGEYDPRKLRKAIEYHGGMIKAIEVGKNLYEVLRVFKKVRFFFSQHPDLGVIFPDVYWEI